MDEVQEDSGEKGGGGRGGGGGVALGLGGHGQFYFGRWETS